ncbi:MAG: sigma-70 family RNA polymerase sigma factor [Polyangiaceae bacterium]
MAWWWSSPHRSAEAVDQWFRQHGGFVLRSLRRLGVSDAEADDLCQAVFLVALEKADRFDGAYPRAWLYQIARRKAADQRRTRAALVVTTPTSQDLASAVDPHLNLERRERRERLVEALAQLEPRQRDVFVLFELEELDMKAVAEAVGCPLKTAYARLYAARRAMRRALRPHEGELGNTRTDEEPRDES